MIINISFHFSGFKTLFECIQYYKSLGYFMFCIGRCSRWSFAYYTESMGEASYTECFRGIVQYGLPGLYPTVQVSYTRGILVLVVSYSVCFIRMIYQSFCHYRRKKSQLVKITALLRKMFFILGVTFICKEQRRVLMSSLKIKI